MKDSAVNKTNTTAEIVYFNGTTLITFTLSFDASKLFVFSSLFMTKFDVELNRDN